MSRQQLGGYGARTRSEVSGSQSFLYLSGLEAPRAHPDLPAPSTLKNVDSLQVRQESALRPVVGVADAVARSRAFSAHVAVVGHRWLP